MLETLNVQDVGHEGGGGIQHAVQDLHRGHKERPAAVHVLLDGGLLGGWDDVVVWPEQTVVDSPHHHLNSSAIDSDIINFPFKKPY